MKKERSKSFKYYLSGYIVLGLGITLLLISITLPLIDKELSYLGWIGFGGVLISCPILFYSFYLLKKGNFIKLNKHLNESKDIEKEL